jgi:hypothetical protein
MQILNSLRSISATFECIFCSNYIQEAYGQFGPYLGHDIALLVMAQPMPISEYILPICLGTYELPLGLQSGNVTLTGFGQDRYKAHRLLRSSDKLQLTTTRYCQEKWSGGISDHKILDGQVCAEPTG